MFEISIININFVLLLTTMLLYWCKSASLLPARYGFLPDLGSVSSGLLQAGFLVQRGFESGHFPLSNLYESLLFLSWSLTTLFLFLSFDLRSNKPFLSAPSFVNPALSLSEGGETPSPTPLVTSLLGSIMTPAILLLNTFAVFSLPSDLKTTGALVPALQSNWLVMHVTVMIMSYGALLAGCLCAIAYLMLSFFVPPKPKIDVAIYEPAPVNPSVGGTVTSKDSGDLPEKPTQRQFLAKKEAYAFFYELAEKLDNLSYRVLRLGFPLLTIGLLSGAVWANQTWGSYWSWDPKETWALITWFVFAIYLHTRLSKGWSGRASALLAVFGFIILWICYLGVNLMGKGLHSYGFLS